MIRSLKLPNQRSLGPDSIQGFDDLPRLPLTFREDWLKDQEEHPPWGTFSPLCDEDWLERGWMLFTTSGTTAARPRVFRHTAFDRDMWSWLGARSQADVGDEFKTEISRIKDVDCVKVSIEPNSQVPRASYAEVQARIARSLKGSLGISMHVEVLPYGSLPRTESKARRVFDLRETF